MNIINHIKLLISNDKELYLRLKGITGYYPRQIELYKQAFVHASASQKESRENNERLEYLGDAILGAVVTEIVYKRFPNKREGFLTTTRSNIVKRETLGTLAKEMGIARLLHTQRNNRSHNSYIGGNAFEALVGALYLDHGFAACQRFVETKMLRHLDINKMAKRESNFKSRLLEWTQKHKVALNFEMVEQSMDKDGNPMFVFRTLLGNKVDGGMGRGYSKKEAQQDAARKALDKLRREQFRKQVLRQPDVAESPSAE